MNGWIKWPILTGAFMTTWNDVKRSEKAWDWRSLMKYFTIDLRELTMEDRENIRSEEVPVDMDEESKTQEVLEEAEIEEEPDKEPDSEIDDDEEEEA